MERPGGESLIETSCEEAMTRLGTTATSIGKSIVATFGDDSDVAFKVMATSCCGTVLQQECSGIGVRSHSPFMRRQHSLSVSESWTPGNRHSMSPLKSSDSRTGSDIVRRRRIGLSISSTTARYQTQSTLGKLALKLVFLLIASTIFFGVAFLGSYLTQADFVAGSGFASITPDTDISAALTAAAHELQIMPSTRSSISLVSSCRTNRLERNASPPTSNRVKSLRIIYSSFRIRDSFRSGKPSGNRVACY